MRTALTILIAITVISTTDLLAYAQKTTEQFIPVGKSPGVSGVSSYMGKIVNVDATNGIINIAGDEKTWSVEITEQTKIWLDRSKYKATNVVGTFDNLRAGLQVEVKHEGDLPRRAQWVKVIPENDQ